MSKNEERLSEAMHSLRGVTGPTVEETSRVAEYVEAIEIELDRIKEARDLR